MQQSAVKFGEYKEEESNILTQKNNGNEKTSGIKYKMKQSAFKFGEYKEEEINTPKNNGNENPSGSTYLPNSNNQKKERNTSIGSSGSSAEAFEDIILRLIDDESNKTHQTQLTEFRYKDKFMNRPRNISRSLSETNLNLIKGYEAVCYNCQKFKLISGKINVLVSLEEQLALNKHKLFKIIRENQSLYDENQHLRNSLESVGTVKQTSFLSMFWGYRRKSNACNSDVNFSVTEMANEIKLLNAKISEYDTELQKKNREIQKQIDNFNVQRRNLKSCFTKKIEIQRSIMEDANQTLKKVESQLNVERQLRIEREAEISHLHNYIDQKEKYYRDQILYNKEHTKRIEANSQLQIERLMRKIVQKDYEISYFDKKGEHPGNNYNKTSESLSDGLEEKSIVNGSTSDKIKIKSLKQELELRLQQLEESNIEIEKLEGNLKVKQQELEQALFKISKSKKQYFIKGHLEQLKLKITEAITKLEEENLLEDCEDRLKSSANKEYKNKGVESCELLVGDKEEVE